MTLFLLLNSIGYNVYAHYCGDSLKDTSLIIETEKSCCEDESEPMDCCDNKAHHVKIEDHFIKTVNVDVDHHILAIASWFIINYQFVSITTVEEFSIDDSILLPPKDNLTILYSNFRI